MIINNISNTIRSNKIRSTKITPNKNRWFIAVTVVLVPLWFVINGCSPRQPVNIIQKNPAEAETTNAKEESTQKKKSRVVWVQQPIETESVVSAGAATGSDYLMNFDDIALPDFIDAMMSGVFKYNYLITDQIKAMPNRFTIKMTEDLKTERAFQLFKSILTMYSVSVEKRENTYLFDVAKTATLTLKGPLVYGRKMPDRLPVGADEEVTFMVPFYNISPETIKPIIIGQLNSRSQVFSIPELNLLVMSGNYEEIRYTLSFIDLLDRAQFKDKSVVMITPEYWDIAEFEDKIRMLLIAEGITIDAMEKTRGILFIPIEKLNSLIVISPNKEWVDRVLYWLGKLDVAEAAGEAKKVYSYKLKNVDVEGVADVLHSYRTGSAVTNTGSYNKSLGLSSGKGGSSSSGLGQGGKSGEAATEPGKNPPTTTEQKTGNTRRSSYTSIGADGNEEAIDNVSIIPVFETNSLIIVATPVEYKKYQDIIKRIDVPRNQVFVEVIIGEVSLDKTTQLGLEFWINRYLYRTSFGTKGGLGVYKGTDTSGNTLTPTGSNFLVNGTLPGTQFEVLINALVENSKINIISTPKITVLENEEAEISVGSDVPVIASESAVPTAQTGTAYYPFRSVQYINTGIILRVKASILTDNKIALVLEQEISEALENKKSDIASPEILKRKIKTTMVVNEGEIAFIGGLFQNKMTTSGKGIPLLSKIPLLGNLFKNSSNQQKKTELVVFINSKTIRQSNDMKDIVEGVKKMYSDKIPIKTETEK